MALTQHLLKLAGKDGLTLDKRIGNSYILRQCVRYGSMLARGAVSSAGYGERSGLVFRGKRVRIVSKKLLHMGNKVRLHEGVYIDAMSTDGVWLGDGVVLGRNTRIECTGSLSYMGKGVRIGNRATFGSDCYFGAAGGIQIGDDVVAGQYVRFHSENHEFDDPETLIREQGVSHKGIRIGNNCWIGAGAVFLDGAELGDGCVVGANAVVTKAFPANSVIAGIPARLVRSRV